MEPIFRNKQVLITASLIAVLAAGCALLLHQMARPVNASNITTVGSAAVPTPPQPVPVSNAYASFSYPGGMEPMAGMEGPMGEEAAVYNYKMQDIVPWHLAITINHLQQPALRYDSNYLVRKNRPSQYQPSTTTLGANTFTVMTDTQAGGFSKVAFALHGDLSVDISLTGDDQSGGSTLVQAFQQVLQSWQWK